MKSLSQWARRNPKISISIIVLLHLILAFIWINLGYDLYHFGIFVPVWVLNASLLVFLLAAVLYPLRHSRLKLYKYTYWRQKLYDFLLIGAAGLMMVTHANHSEYLYHNNTGKEAIVQPIVLKEKAVEKREMTKAEKKSWRKKIKENRKKIKSEIRATVKELRGESATAGQIGLLLLTILGALILLGLVVSLSCSLSCSGSPGAATLVLLLGLGLTIFLSIVVIRAIFKKSKKSNKVIY